MKTSWIIAMSAAGLIGASGCSFLGVRGPPSRTPGTPAPDPKTVECTDSKALPHLDTGAAALMGAMAIGLGIAAGVNNQPCIPNGDPLHCAFSGLGTAILGTAAAGAGLVGLVTAISAGYGYSRVGDCRRAKGLEVERVDPFLKAAAPPGTFQPSEDYRGPGNLALEENVDRPSADYRAFSLEGESPLPCRDACAREKRCRAFTWVRARERSVTAFCFLKEVVPRPVANRAGYVSGTK
jgi:hypothetical protein